MDVATIGIDRHGKCTAYLIPLEECGRYLRFADGETVTCIPDVVHLGRDAGRYFSSKKVITNFGWYQDRLMKLAARLTTMQLEYSAGGSGQESDSTRVFDIDLMDREILDETRELCSKIIQAAVSVH